jgi:hypothetical protein
MSRKKVHRHRVLKYDREKAAKEFNAIVRALNATQPVVYQEVEFDQVTVRVPKFYKDELWADKARYGIPMGAQLRAFGMVNRRLGRGK